MFAAGSLSGQSIVCAQAPVPDIVAAAALARVKLLPLEQVCAEVRARECIRSSGVGLPDYCDHFKVRHIYFAARLSYNMVLLNEFIPSVFFVLSLVVCLPAALQVSCSCSVTHDDHNFMHQYIKAIWIYESIRPDCSLTEMSWPDCTTQTLRSVPMIMAIFRSLQATHTVCKHTSCREQHSVTGQLVDPNSGSR